MQKFTDFCLICVESLTLTSALTLAAAVDAPNGNAAIDSCSEKADSLTLEGQQPNLT